MKVAIMQPYFFPYIGYWQLIQSVDKFVIYDDVNFIKGGWINRNNVMNNHRKVLITLPIMGASPNKKILDLEFTSDVKIKKKLVKTIEQLYRRAPFFAQIFPILEKIILSEEKNVAKYLCNLIITIVNYLGIHTQIILSSEIAKNNQLKSEGKVIDIVKNLGGTTYINSIGGIELYSKQKFKENDINLFFLKSENCTYQQFTDLFIENLSIIDVMMFNSPEKIHEMLGSYQLI